MTATFFPQRLLQYLVQLALLDVDFGLGRRRRLGRLERKAGQGKLWSRDGVQDTNSAPPNENVDEGVLEQRSEHEHKTNGHPDVNRLDV